MNKLAVGLVALTLLAAFAAIGCSSGDVSSSDVNKWQNEGRSPDDKSNPQASDSR